MLLEIKIDKGNQKETIYMDDQKIIVRGTIQKEIPKDIDDLIDKIKYNLIYPKVQYYGDGFSIKAKNGYVRYFM
jgi:hypothetical protein